MQGKGDVRAADKQQYPSKDQPLVMRVGHMGPAYWKWIDQPETGQPRFFEHPAMEALTKTPWWVVPSVWTPVSMAIALCTLKWGYLTLPALTSCFLIGIVVWQLVEYCIHRFLFHFHSSTYWGITVHFLFHGNHHKFPFDHDRLVFPPVPASLVVALGYGLLLIMLPKGLALGVLSGAIFGYVIYDVIHFSLHHGHPAVTWVLSELKHRHVVHHFKDDTVGFGISSVLFDVLFGTELKPGF